MGENTNPDEIMFGTPEFKEKFADAVEFKERFKWFIMKMRGRFIEKQPVHDNTWKTLPLQELADKLDTQLFILNEALTALMHGESPNEEEAKYILKELTDTANRCLTVAIRLVK